jgi:hypothetical protein
MSQNKQLKVLLKKLKAYAEEVEQAIEEGMEKKPVIKTPYVFYFVLGFLSSSITYAVLTRIEVDNTLFLSVLLSLAIFIGKEFYDVKREDKFRIHDVTSAILGIALGALNLLIALSHI